jgi:hypothetical protein
MFESHSGEYMFELVKDVFDVICPTTWRRKLNSMSSDGASAMTGGYQGIVSRIEKEVSASNGISNYRFLISFIVFGVVYINLLLDLVMRGSYEDIANGKWFTLTTVFTGHLRIQYELVADIGSKCPKLATLWAALGTMCTWFLDNRIRLLRHMAESSPPSAPPV